MKSSYTAARSAAPTEQQKRYPRPPRPHAVTGLQCCYAAVKGCGCVVAVIIPEFCSTRDIGYRVAPWMRRGWAIERMRVAEARQALQKCHHEPRPAHQGELFTSTRTA